MRNTTEVVQLLEELGLGKTEAAAYVQLLILSPQGPATGYQVAKALGKNPTTVYSALEELLKRGAVETVAGRGKQFRPIPPEALTHKLQEDYKFRVQYTKDQLTKLPQETRDDEMFRLHDLFQVLHRFGELLDGSTQVALLDLAPDLLDHYLDRILAAANRGVSVVIKLYAEPTELQIAQLADIPFTVDPDGDLMLKIMPGPVLHGAFDCSAQLVTYLPWNWQDEQPGSNVSIPQAFWTGNRFLAYQAHSGLASEIIHTELRAMLLGGNDAGEMQARQDWLAGCIHGPVDWEGFWDDTGWGDVAGAPEVRDEFPWGADEDSCRGLFVAQPRRPYKIILEPAEELENDKDPEDQS